MYADIAGLCHHHTFFRMVDIKGAMGKTFDYKYDDGSYSEIKKRVGE